MNEPKNSGKTNQRLASGIVSKHAPLLESLLGYTKRAFQAAKEKSTEFPQDEMYSYQRNTANLEMQAIEGMVQTIEGTASPNMGLPEDPQEWLRRGTKVLTQLARVAKSFGSTEEEVRALIADVSQLAGMNTAAGKITKSPGVNEVQ